MWKRAGQVGTIAGLEWPAALDLIPAAADRERVSHLLRDWEAGMLEGAAQLAKTRTPKEDEE